MCWFYCERYVVINTVSLVDVSGLDINEKIHIREPNESIYKENKSCDKSSGYPTHLNALVS